MVLRWHDRTFGELSVVDLYAIMELRQRVFVVEQRCACLDADGLDRVARHLWAEPGMPAGAGEEDKLVAYLRIVPAGARFAEISLGRMVIAPEVRRTGLGRTLIARGLAAVGRVPVRISAQEHLERFYTELGFRRASEAYLEDGIPHLEMLRA